MKKKSLKNLSLAKSIISNLQVSKINGGNEIIDAIEKTQTCPNRTCPRPSVRVC